MTPVEASYTLNGKEGEKVFAKDGVPVVLSTPAGVATAQLDPRKGNFFEGTLAERFETQFPGQPPYREVISIFNIPKIIKYNQEINMVTLTRSKKYQTNKGEIVIELKAINTDL